MNGVEAAINSLRNDVRVILLHSGLPTNMAGAAILHAVRVHTALSQVGNQSKYHGFTGRHANLTNVHPFVCLASYRIPDLTGKAIARGREGIYLGTSEDTKTHRVWCLEGKKIVASVDVDFDHLSFPGKDMGFGDTLQENFNLTRIRHGQTGWRKNCRGTEGRGREKRRAWRARCSC